MYSGFSIGWQMHWSGGGLTEGAQNLFTRFAQGYTHAVDFVRNKSEFQVTLLITSLIASLEPLRNVYGVRAFKTTAIVL